MAFTRGSGHEALRRGRWSSSGAEYFLTICTADRADGLTMPPLATEILNQAHRLSDEGIWHVRTATVLPDHVHLLITLGAWAELSATIRLFKGRLAPALRAAALHWQRGCFDHRIRCNEDRLPVFLYVFLNPYRANLIKQPERWPAYYCAPEDWSWFELLTNHSHPEPEWLL